MRKEICEMMNYWVDLGISGFRMDVIDLIGKVPDRKIKENGPQLHEYLQEMNREVLRGKDLLTVGECWGATPEIGRLYSDPARNELSMVFQFEHCALDSPPNGSRWDLKKLELPDAEAMIQKLEEKGCIHEKTFRVVNHFSYNGDMTYEQLAEWGAQRVILAACDGMEVTFKH